MSRSCESLDHVSPADSSQLIYDWPDWQRRVRGGRKTPQISLYHTSRHTSNKEVSNSMRPDCKKKRQFPHLDGAAQTTGCIRAAHVLPFHHVHWSTRTTAIESLRLESSENEARTRKLTRMNSPNKAAIKWLLVIKYIYTLFYWCKNCLTNMTTWKFLLWIPCECWNMNTDQASISCIINRTAEIQNMVCWTHSNSEIRS